MTKSVQQIIDDGHGATYRYRDYHGNDLNVREEVWRVELAAPLTEDDHLVLRHYGQPLVCWDYKANGNRVAWLTEYSLLNELTASDKNGIRKVNPWLI